MGSGTARNLRSVSSATARRERLSRRGFQACRDGGAGARRKTVKHIVVYASTFRVRMTCHPTRNVLSIPLRNSAPLVGPLLSSRHSNLPRGKRLLALQSSSRKSVD